MKPQTKIMYDAYMRGESHTNQTSKDQYGVEALSQRSGEITRDPSVPEVVSSKRVKGKPYSIHWIQGAIKITTKPTKQPIRVAAHFRRPTPVQELQESFGW